MEDLGSDAVIDENDSNPFMVIFLAGFEVQVD